MAKIKNEAAPERESGKKAEKPEKGALPQGDGPLLTILTILLVAVGIFELALGVFMGFGLYRGILAQRAYEARSKDDEPGQTEAVQTGASYAGPWLTIENGTVTWRREEGLGGSDGTQSGLEAGDGLDERTYPRAPSSPPSGWVQTIDRVDSAAG